ncbi:hypothetical protein ANO14919_026170 [Xylariales sp. No.14919]|nr:hypothetical protein ANO14919_026170 [Xylariales sp. No.14919]
MSYGPIVKQDGFVFLGELHAEASGHNHHRRATIPELEAHFKSGSDKDHPAHWFEAQLTHYGLQPSKTKSVARMRLFDAVNSGNLTVPPRIRALEANLKKEWKKNQKDYSKTAAKDIVSASTSVTGAVSKKRKADSSNLDANINIGGINITVSMNNSSASSSSTKKAKTSTTTTATAPRKAVKGNPKPKNKPASQKATKPVKKQTARRGGISQAPARGSTSTANEATDGATRPRQTARRCGTPMARGRVPTSAFVPDNDFDDPPPPYREYDHYDDGDSAGDGYDSSDGDRARYGDYDDYDDYYAHGNRSVYDGISSVGYGPSNSSRSSSSNYSDYGDRDDNNDCYDDGDHYGDSDSEGDSSGYGGSSYGDDSDDSDDY